MVNSAFFDAEDKQNAEEPGTGDTEVVTAGLALALGYPVRMRT